jgi:hypothetical protein
MTSRLFRASAFAAAAALLAAASPAAPPEGATPACPAIDPPSPVFAAGVRAAIDPATGAPRALTPEERQEAALRRAAAKAEALRRVRIVTHPNGMTTADFGDAFLMDVVVETRPDGTAGYRCVPSSSKTAASSVQRELK